MKNESGIDRKAALALSESEPYRRLTRARNRLQWLLVGVVLVAYYGFILLVAFGKNTLAMRLGESVTTVAIPVSLGVVAIAIATTAIYVFAANRRFDPLNQSIANTVSK